MTFVKGVEWGTGKMTSSRFKACLLGGAIGDALGYPVEFMTRDAILGFSAMRALLTYFGRFAGEDYNWLKADDMEYKSPLLGCRELYKRRTPGNTCLSALRSATHQNFGTIDDHINNSKGCGGVMRVAPAGLMFHDSPEYAFRVAADCAAITHGHPSGYLSAL